jgi:hypothetical protein
MAGAAYTLEPSTTTVVRRGDSAAHAAGEPNMPVAIMTSIAPCMEAMRFVELAALVIVICVCGAEAWRSGSAFSSERPLDDERRLTL